MRRPSSSRSKTEIRSVKYLCFYLFSAAYSLSRFISLAPFVIVFLLVFSSGLLFGFSLCLFTCDDVAFMHLFMTKGLVFRVYGLGIRLWGVSAGAP